MKRPLILCSILVGAIVVAALLFLLPSQAVTAQCTGLPASGAPDTVDCAGPITSNINTQGGNDTITLEGVDGAVVRGGSGNDSITNTDDVDGAILGQDGNDTITNSGDLCGSELGGGADNDTIINSGELCGSGITGGGGNDTIQNSGDLYDSALYGEGGDDSITNSGDFYGSTTFFDGGLVGGNGNDTINNSGDFYGSDFISGNGNDVINNSGYFCGSFMQAGTGDDVINNTGDFCSSELRAGNGNDTINSTADFAFSLLSGGDGDDVINFSGSFDTGWLRGGEGSDTVTISMVGTFNSDTLIDGDRIDDISGNNDKLILQFSGTQEGFNAFKATVDALDLTACQAIPDTSTALSAGCYASYNGSTYVIINFEQIVVIALAILEEQGFDISMPPGPQEHCSDNLIKVFKLPNGDVEYYAGFAQVNVPNGFLVGKVSLSQLAAGVRRFQDRGPLNPGWYVVIREDGNALKGQVYDQNNKPVGMECQH